MYYEEEERLLELQQQVQQLQEALRREKTQLSAALESPSCYATRILKQNEMEFREIPTLNTSGSGIVNCPRRKFKDEYEFNSEFHAELAQVFGESRLFNTERHSYIPASDKTTNDKKPDWAIFEIGNLMELKRAPSITNSDIICYATPPEELLDFLTLVLEGKVGTGNLTTTDLAALFTYLALLLKADHPNPRGVLYNQREFIYAEYDNINCCLTNIVRSTWSTPGCKEFLQEKCAPPPAMVKLVQALRDGSVTPRRWLGRGRFGLVLEAESGGVTFALKIVLDHFELLQAEFEKLCAAHKKVGVLVVQPVANSLVISDSYAYYRMSEVGKSSDGILRRNYFKLMCALHLQRIVHGDPRIQNVVEVGDVYKWVDMRDVSETFNEHTVKNDMRTVIQSSFRCNADTIDYSPAIASSLGVYCTDVSMPHVEELYETCKNLIA
jgi:hypothetical protein